MHDYLERLEKLLISKDQDKLKNLQLEVGSAIDAYADLVESLKRQHFGFNKRCEELCLVRNMIQKQLKEKDDEC